MPAPSDPSELPVRGVGSLEATRLDVAAQALLADKALGWRVEVSAPGVLGLLSAHGRVLLIDSEDDPARLPLELDRLRRHPYPASHVLAFVHPSLPEWLERNAAELARLGIWLLCADGRSTWQNRAPRWSERRVSRALKAAASGALAPRSWSAAEAAAHARRIDLDPFILRQEARDLEQHRALYAARPRATVVLLGLILLVFGLQYLWGGVDLPPLLVRMGSMVPERALAGEWWRFLACTFLHGGVLHLALNGLGLWMLGRSLEPLIGTPRFVFIYFASGLAGSLASSLFVTSQSVGASGAIWGLLGAHAALAFHPRPLLPPPLVAMAQRAAAANLGLNLLNSFNPHIDVAAHVGGGSMGALALVLMALSGGLSSHGRGPRSAGLALRAAAGMLAVVFVAGCARGIVAGQPWRLDRQPELARVELPDSPWSVAVPRGQTRGAVSGGTDSREFGNLSHDPSVVDISWVPLFDASTEREPSGQLPMILRQLATVPEGLTELIPPRIVQDDASPARPHVAVRYRYLSNVDVVDDRVIGVIDGSLVRVDVIAWAALPRAFDGLAPRILRSFERSGVSTAARLQPSGAGGGVFHSGVWSPPRVGERVKVSDEGTLFPRMSGPFLDFDVSASTRRPEP